MTETKTEAPVNIQEEPTKYCSGEMVPTESIKSNPANPNIHPEDQLKVMGQVLARHGWREALVVSRRSGLLVKGHGRLQAAKMAGFTLVPVEYQDYADEQQEIADLIADNRLAQGSFMDALGLGALMRKMSKEARAGTGFTEEEMGLFMAAEFVPAAPTDRKFEVLESFKLRKLEKQFVGLAVQRLCLIEGREMPWGEALMKICVEWSGGTLVAPALDPLVEKPAPAKAPAKAKEKPKAEPPKAEGAVPTNPSVLIEVDQSFAFVVSRIAKTDVDGHEVYVVYAVKGDQKYYLAEEDLLPLLRESKAGGFEVLAQVHPDAGKMWIVSAERRK